jgi:hypothetical protein
MKRILTFLLLVSLLAAMPAAAGEMIVVEAPWLTGPVTPYGPELAGTIVLPGDIAVVLSASVELSGLAVEGTFTCLDDPAVYPAPVGIEVYIGNACIDQVPGYFAAEILDVVGEGTFAASVIWIPFAGDPAPWSCWVDEPLHVSLAWAYGLIGICDYVEMPSLDIAEGRFIVEIDPAIAVTVESWGAVKAFYR